MWYGEDNMNNNLITRIPAFALTAVTVMLVYLTIVHYSTYLLVFTIILSVLLIVTWERVYLYDKIDELESKRK